MTARHDDDVGGLSGIKVSSCIIEVEGMHLAGRRKPFLRGVGRAIIRHDDIKSGKAAALQRLNATWPAPKI